jgi:hypothetical protein
VSVPLEIAPKGASSLPKAEAQPQAERKNTPLTGEMLDKTG